MASRNKIIRKLEKDSQLDQEQKPKILNYCENQKTLEQKNDMKVIQKSNSFTSNVLNPPLNKMGLLTLHNCCVSCSFDHLQSELESESHFPISEFSVERKIKSNNLYINLACLSVCLFVSNKRQNG